MHVTVLRLRHSRESGNPGCKPAFDEKFKTWIPAFAGMTTFAFAGVTLLLAACFLSATTSDPLSDFPNRVHKFTLKNGMRILVVERPESQTIAFNMYIRTGGLDDASGQSGIAHMFEHMLFKGTKTIGTKDYAKEAPLLEAIDEIQQELQRCHPVESVSRHPGKSLAGITKDILPAGFMDSGLRHAGMTISASSGVTTGGCDLEALNKRLVDLNQKHEALLEAEEYWRIYERAGGQGLNASTGYDFTNYTVSLPKNYLKLWFTMEADRIKNPVLREFYKERAVVQEERRQRIDTSPGGKLWEAFLGTAFLAHPYRRPIVGWESDISRITRKDAIRFFQQHYDVSRLVVGIVGGVKADEIEALCKLYYEPISSNPSAEQAHITVEPAQEGERRVSVEFDAEPSLMIGYHRPDMNDLDNPALIALEDILNSGRTSRFYRSIVEKLKIAVSAWASASGPGERDPSLFLVGGTPRSPHTAQDLERALINEIEKIKTVAPSAREVEKVKNNMESNLIRGLSSNEGLAGQLAYHEALAGDWRYLLSLIEGIRKVTPTDVQRVAQKYLTASNRTVGVLVRKKP